MKQIIREALPLLQRKLENYNKDITNPDVYALISETRDTIEILVKELEQKNLEISSLELVHRELTDALRRSKLEINHLLGEYNDGFNNQIGSL